MKLIGGHVFFHFSHVLVVGVKNKASSIGADLKKIDSKTMSYILLRVCIGFLPSNYPTLARSTTGFSLLDCVSMCVCVFFSLHILRSFIFHFSLCLPLIFFSSLRFFLSTFFVIAAACCYPMPIHCAIMFGRMGTFYV